MALIRLGAMLTDISGKIGGQTFGTSASGSYVKNSGTPRKSITLAQRSKMALMGTTAQRWRALTQAQRNVFIAASPDYPYLNRVGETKYYSGYAIYTQLVNNLAGNSFSLTPVPLPKFTFTPLLLVDSSPPTDDSYLQFDNAQAGVNYRLFMTRISSPGISSPYKNHFFIMSDQVTPPVDVDFNYGTAYTQKWGAFPSSGRFYYRVDAIQVSTGQIYKGLNSGVFTY